MTLRVALSHKTRYNFDRPVELSPHIIRLRPAPHTRSQIVSYSMKVEPSKHFLNWQQDAFGNWLGRIVFEEKCTHLSVEIEVILDMTVINPFDFFLEESAETFPLKYDKQTKRELSPYLEIDERGRWLKRWVRPWKKIRGQRTIEFLYAINAQLQSDIGYQIRMEPGVQTCEETLKRGKGSCRDSAWLLVQILRHLGLAARFVSGYLVQLKPDQESLDGPSGPAEDFTDLHAWCEVYLPGAGWVGLDPTSGLYASEGHIPLACTPQPVSAAPISGATDPCEVEFEHSNSVTRILEDPRVTKPYSEDQWQAIDALGNKLEKELERLDVRLTMGGEPTFVSIDDMESDQWNTGALGDDKLRLSQELLSKLKRRFAENGISHYGQGKWYPGEELPRWALGVFWRTDGEALWHNPKLLADINKDYKASFDDAKTYAAKLCDILELPNECAQIATEDAYHYIIQEQQLPVELNSEKANLKDSLERKRLARLLQRGLDSPTGLVLPLEFSTEHGWQSSVWKLRTEHIILAPGDSPMGLRLPLGSISGSERKPDNPDGIDPFTSKQALGSFTAPKPKRKRIALADYPIHTSLCIEPRDGRLYLFMPPVKVLDQWVWLVNAIEEAAAACGTAVVIEGYEPPKDSRIQCLKVTPDPGVIEVNIHPAKNWDELRKTTFTLYEEARKTRLGTEKFMLDGRHTGTGGGNHITLGAANPADSPMLRRPDVLASLITYWQHHPSLSYVFSGMFIGSTSQAPRVDEGRDPAVYELEIALQQLAKVDPKQPWQVDRIMRNLLVDLTGNTHRAEFCIDKLYAPGSSSGRLGLLEFRGFEMPPHPQMALVQALFIRALLVKFWKTPYNKPPIHWGTQLHDRWMLPHYIWQDLKEICGDLEDDGIPFQIEWLAPFEEFRFPHYGRMQVDNIALELRWAIEPWDVLGEESSSSGTARYVDSSVERVQLKLNGLVDGRHVLCCNGRRVPLQATGRHGEYVAGVRYKAWAPPSALHPTIDVHTPLVFDIIDTWNGRSIAGCSYHVSHPGGLSYDHFPVNAAEAESRRINRFLVQDHSQGPLLMHPKTQALREFTTNSDSARPLAPPEEEPSNLYPCTLDLRIKP